MPEDVLRVEGLTKRYSSATGELTVLSEVSFALRAGETCAVVGPSGSGKTTLLGLCAGLDQPTSGDVWFEGTALSTLDEERRARLRLERVGFIFQSFQLLPTLTALENVMVPLELMGASDARVRAVELLERVGLGERLANYPSQLSGGEQQRVGIARAFVHRPRLLFADEPTGSLDHATAEHVASMLFELTRTADTALVLVTHDMELAQRAHWILRLRGGRRVVES